MRAGIKNKSTMAKKYSESILFKFNFDIIVNLTLVGQLLARARQTLVAATTALVAVKAAVLLATCCSPSRSPPAHTLPDART